MPHSLSCVAAAENLVAQHKPALAAGFRFGDWPVRVRSNSREVIDHLRSYHAEFVDDEIQTDCTVYALQGEPPAYEQTFTLQTRAPGKGSLKEEYLDLPDGRVIRKVRTGMVFVLASDWNVAVGPCEENLNQVVNFLDSRLMQHRLGDGGMLLHAAGVSHRGWGLALGGVSGLGKSTLALHLVGQDLQYVSNDRLIVERRPGGLIAHGVPKKPRVNPGTLLHNPQLSVMLDEGQRRRYAALEPTELWHLQDKYDIDLVRCFGPGRQILQCRLGCVIVLTWQWAKSGAMLVPVSGDRRIELMPAIMKTPGVFFDQRTNQRCEQLSAADYAESLSGCPMFELCGGVDFEWATRACRDLLLQVVQRVKPA